jgi:hypothetical protein
MKKIVLVLGLVLGIAVSVNSAEAQAKVLTKQEAAKKIAAASKKAYTSKKTVKCTVKIKSSEKNVEKNVKALKELVKKAQWGKYAGSPYNWTYCVSIDSIQKVTPKGVITKTYKGTLTLTQKISYSDVKWSYENYPYFVKICEQLESATKDMSQVEKAAYVDSWLGARLGYHLASEEGKSNIAYFATPKRIWKGTAFGQCEVRAKEYARYAKIAGVKHVATVDIPEINHLSSAVRFEDGRIFCFDLGFTYHRGFDYGCVGKGFTEDDAASDIGEELARAMFEENFENSDWNPECVSGTPHKLQITWYQENKSETFTGKQQQKVNGLIYSKYACSAEHLLVRCSLNFGKRNDFFYI